MKIKMKELAKGIFLLAGVYALMSCSHTVQGMRADIHEATEPPPSKVVHVKVVPVKRSPPAVSSPDLPPSPPPLETP
jgi:hypothetical protein